MDMKLEVVGIPVSDVDRAIAFYRDQVGFNLDHDMAPAEGMRVVQMTPPGSPASIVFGVGMPIDLYIGQDDRDATRYVPSLVQAGLGLPNRDYYLDLDDAKFRDVRAKYVGYLTTLLTLGGQDAAGAAADAQAILALETKLARAQWSAVEIRDPVRAYNRVALADLCMSREQRAQARRRAKAAPGPCRGCQPRDTRSASACPTSSVPAWPPMSRVRGPPSRSRVSMAPTMAPAASVSPRCSSIMAPDQI